MSGRPDAERIVDTPAELRIDLEALGFRRIGLVLHHDPGSDLPRVAHGVVTEVFADPEDQAQATVEGWLGHWTISFQTALEDGAIVLTRYVPPNAFVDLPASWVLASHPAAGKVAQLRRDWEPAVIWSDHRLLVRQTCASRETRPVVHDHVGVHLAVAARSGAAVQRFAVAMVRTWGSLAVLSAMGTLLSSQWLADMWLERVVFAISAVPLLTLLWIVLALQLPWTRWVGRFASMPVTPLKTGIPLGSLADLPRDPPPWPADVRVPQGCGWGCVAAPLSVLGLAASWGAWWVSQPACVPAPLDPDQSLAVLDSSNLHDLRPVATLCDPQWGGPVQDVRFLDPRTLVVAGRAQLVSLWPVEGRPVRLAGTGDVLAVDHRGDRLALGGDDGRLTLWSREEDRAVWSTQAHQGSIREVRFAPDGSVLTFGLDASVARWDADAQEVARRPLSGKGWCGAVSPEGGELAACAGGQVVLLEVGSLTPLGALQDAREKTWGVAWSADGDELVAVGDEPDLTRYDRAARKPIDALDLRQGTVRDVVHLPGGGYAAVSWDSRLFVVTEAGRSPVRFDARQGRIQTVDASGDGRLIATGGEDGVVRLWGVPD